MIKNPRTPDYREKLEIQRGISNPTFWVGASIVMLGQLPLANFFFTTVILGSRVWVTNLV